MHKGGTALDADPQSTACSTGERWLFIYVERHESSPLCGTRRRATSRLSECACTKPRLHLKQHPASRIRSAIEPPLSSQPVNVTRDLHLRLHAPFKLRDVPRHQRNTHSQRGVRAAPSDKPAHRPNC